MVSGLLGFAWGRLEATFPVGITFDPARWAAEQCHMPEPDGGDHGTTSQQGACFEYHYEHWDYLTRAPGRKLATRSLLVAALGAVVFLAGVALVVWPLRPIRVNPIGQQSP
jgi:hypothetical protein